MKTKKQRKTKIKKRRETRRKNQITEYLQSTMRSHYARLAVTAILLCLWVFQHSLRSLNDLHQQVDLTPDQSSSFLSTLGLINNQQKAVPGEHTKTMIGVEEKAGVTETAVTTIPIQVPEDYKDRLHFHIISRGKRGGDCEMCQSLFGLYDSLVALNFSASHLKFDRNHLTTKESVVFVYPETDSHSMEGPIGNRVHVRWVLAPRETYPTLNVHSWQEDDLVFNFASSAAQEGLSSRNILQAFTTAQIGDDTDISNEAFFAKNRSGVAWMLRNADKFHGLNGNLHYIHERPSMPSTKLLPRQGSPIKVADFRKHEYFVSYDPYTFYTFIAAMSGTISIIYPIENVSKDEWALGTYVGEYLREVGGQIPGIAYGWTDKEILYAKKTMPDLREFLFKVKKWGETNTIERMARDAYRFGNGHRSGFEAAMFVRDAFPSYFIDDSKIKTNDTTPTNHSSNSENLRTIKNVVTTTKRHGFENLLSKIQNWIKKSPPAKEEIKFHGINSTQWKWDECDVIYHVHIPKTGGSSILKTMENMTNYTYYNLGAQNYYIFHGRGVKKTVIPFLDKNLDENTTARRNKPILLTGEVGVLDLYEKGYDRFFNRTCFFTAVRDPYEWLLSAKNYMKVTSGYNGGFDEHVGYFDRRNIQSFMTSYGMNNSISSAVRTGKMCVYTISKINELLCELDATSKACQKLQKANAFSYKKVITDEVKQVVHKKYSRDLELWNKTVEHKGRFCW